MFFFFNDTATTEIYTLSLHDALPISFCPASVWPRSPFSTDRSPPTAQSVRRPKCCAHGNAGSTSSSAPRCRRRSTSRSEEHTSELQSPDHLVCRLLLEKKKSLYQQRR